MATIAKVVNARIEDIHYSTPEGEDPSDPKHYFFMLLKGDGDQLFVVHEKNLNQNQLVNPAGILTEILGNPHQHHNLAGLKKWMVRVAVSETGDPLWLSSMTGKTPRNTWETWFRLKDLSLWRFGAESRDLQEQIYRPAHVYAEVPVCEAERTQIKSLIKYGPSNVQIQDPQVTFGGSSGRPLAEVALCLEGLRGSTWVTLTSSVDDLGKLMLTITDMAGVDRWEQLKGKYIRMHTVDNGNVSGFQSAIRRTAIVFHQQQLAETANGQLWSGNPPPRLGGGRRVAHPT